MKKRNISIDYLKILLTIFVIITHYNFTDSERLNMLFPFYINFAVPIFLLLFGYNLASSFEKRNINSLSDAYNFKYILNRIVRFIIPFSIIYILEILYSCIILKNSYSLSNLIYLFFQGGIGYGSYFNTVVLQLVIIFPIIYFIIKKYDIDGLIGCFMFVVLYEYLKKIFYIDFATYRLLSLHYVFIIAYGIYLYLSKSIIKNIVYYLSFLIGGLYIFAVCYGNYNPHIFNYWIDRSLITSLYYIPIITFIIKYDKIKSNSFITLLSKSSYNVFLVQMFYYYIISSKNIIMFDITFFNILTNIIICFLLGILFYLIENKLTNYIVNKINSHNYKINIFLKKIFIK